MMIIVNIRERSNTTEGCHLLSGAADYVDDGRTGALEIYPIDGSSGDRTGLNQYRLRKKKATSGRSCAAGGSKYVATVAGELLAWQAT